MLVNLNDVLVPARKGKYAVGLFNTVNLELARGVMEAAEELDSPVIIGTAEVLLPYGPLEDLANLLIPMAERASVPVVVHLDHGLKEETCRLALELGFSSIMYDCSTMDYGDNMEHVKRMAETAHSFGASIEAELGHVGDNEGGSAEGSGPGAEPSQFYTDPVQARDFIDRTGADALAIAVGTAHGAYKLPPKLDFDRIVKIKELTGLPLVMHGGSGISVADTQRAIRCGIRKINYFSYMSNAGVKAVKKLLEEKEVKYFHDLANAAVDAMEQDVLNAMSMFALE